MRRTDVVPLTPTRFGDLNAVLAELVTGVQDALGATLCGAYLQGSFALGDADEHSDVDFLVVTHTDPVLADRTLAFVEHTASVAAASSGRMLPRR